MFTIDNQAVAVVYIRKALKTYKDYLLVCWRMQHPFFRTIMLVFGKS